MFKVGDVVKCIDPPYASFSLTKGKTYVVQTTRGYCGFWVEVIGDDGNKSTLYSTRFELADPIASMSDQQLADDFRTTNRRYWELSDELIKRGYAITFWRGTHYSPPLKRQFSQAGEIPKIKIEKEKKEIISL